MVSHNIRAFGFSILGLGFATYILIFLLTQELSSIDFEIAFSHISTTISINIVIWIVFIKWLWKTKLFYPWLVQVPDLSGKWEGEIRSNYSESNSEIPIAITITQTFLNIQVQIRSEESQSFSIASKFNIDHDRGQQQLFYAYLNTPRAGVRDRSEIHYGSVILNFDGRAINTMDGEYWTSRNTRGEIRLTRAMPNN